MDNILSLIWTPAFFFSVIRVTTPILLAALAAVIADRAGVFNIAIEGIMLVTALTGVLFSAWTQSAWMGLLCAVIMGCAFGYIMAFFSLRMDVDLTMTGIAINLIGSGGTVFILYVLTGNRAASTSLASKVLPSVSIPLLRDIPVIGEILSGHNVITYLAFACVIILYYVLFKTKIGLRIRSVGENPLAAQSVGINVYRIQVTALIISGALAGLAGSYMSMGYLSFFSKDMTAGRGWIALAASNMGGTHPLGAALASFLFGFADAVGNYLKMLNISSYLISAIPYVCTIVGLGVYSYIARRNLWRKTKNKASR